MKSAHSSVTQGEAGYVNHPVDGERCGVCTMFIASLRACTLVRGDISEMGHCRFYDPKPAFKTFRQAFKNEPSAGDVHVTTAIGNSGDRPRKWKPFGAIIAGYTPPVKVSGNQATFGPSPVKTALNKRYASVADLPQTVRDKLKGKKRRQWMHVFNSVYDGHSDLPTKERESRAFAGAWATVQKAAAIDDPPLMGLKNRRLDAYDADTYHMPFRYQPAALNVLRQDQVPRFLDAVTHPDRLPLREVRLDQLYGIQDRIGRDVIKGKLDKLNNGGGLKPPTVIRLAGADHIADGHDRLAARWLNGDETALVHHSDLDPVSEAKPDPRSDHLGSRFDLLQPKNGRRLTWHPNGTLASPFVHDPTFLSTLREDQVPRFFDAITHQKRIDRTEKVRLDSLRAIQDRVNPDSVAAHVEAPTKKLPIVVRAHGTEYIADGHDRLAARWLRGKNGATVRYVDLGDVPSSAVKREPAFEIPFKISKADPDKQQIFGWASVVTKNGQPIIDKQGDIIPVDELEKAFYDYVLYSRDQGHMHSKMGVGKLIECMVFTKEKQNVLKIDLGFEGAWVGYQVEDHDVWAAHKRGELPEFSIGGAAVPIEVEV